VTRDSANGTLASITLALVCVGIAGRRGLSAADLGVGRDRIAAGSRWGLGVGAPLVAVVHVLSLVPATRGLFVDARYLQLSGPEAARHLFVRIPFGTALSEELVFRGVLLAALRRQWRQPVAVAVSSALFGLGHVLPALAFTRANAGVPGSGSGAALTVGATVVATGAAGAGLAWLRLRSGSLAAPVLVHAAVNAGALAATRARSR
jgi:uncharacterized protein